MRETSWTLKSHTFSFTHRETDKPKWNELKSIFSIFFSFSNKMTIDFYILFSCSFISIWFEIVHNEFHLELSQKKNFHRIIIVIITKKNEKMLCCCCCCLLIGMILRKKIVPISTKMKSTKCMFGWLVWLVWLVLLFIQCLSKYCLLIDRVDI